MLEISNKNKLLFSGTELLLWLMSSENAYIELVTSDTLSGWSVYESKSVHTCIVYPGVRLDRRNHKIWVIINQVLPDLRTLMIIVFIDLAASEVTH